MNPISILSGGKSAIENLAKLALAAALVYAGYKIYQKFKQRNTGKSGSINKSNLDPSKNYDSYAKSVYDAFVKPWVNDGDEMEKTAKQLLFLNDDELKYVNNRFISIYGNDKSFQDAISDPICIFCESRDLLLERLERLNLN